MNNFFRKKDGEITSQQIVILVIVIVSFAVILFFLFRLNLGDASDDELCHNSVLTRGSAVIPSDVIPLNCHRKYVCVTKSGGNCEGLTNPERIEVKSLDEIYNALSEQMANCWWMFGEGRINYVGGDTSRNNYCSLCSQIYFDKSLESITGNEIDKEGLYNFLQNKKYDETNNYTNYLFGVNDIKDIKKKALEANDKSTFGKIQIGDTYFVVMGITSSVSLWEWAGIGSGLGTVAVVGGSIATSIGLLSNPVGWVTGIILIGGGAGIGAGVGSVVDLKDPEIAIISVDGRGIDNKFIAPTLIKANSDSFNVLNCKDILTLA